MLIVLGRVSTVIRQSCLLLVIATNIKYARYFAVAYCCVRKCELLDKSMSIQYNTIQYNNKTYLAMLTI